ncbi:MAG: TetR/AcrR family transcriptional regulator [Pseudomonadota bacterium]
MALKTKIERPARRGDTRERLIDAAIAELAENGFSAAKGRSIAARAGVTSGPLQYHFPTTIDLYAAVVDRMHAGDDSKARKALADGEPPAVRLRRLIEVFIEGCGSPHHIAMIELKLACRGDARLRDAVGAKIVAYEKRVDADWVAHFADSGLSAKKLKELRTLLAAMARGLGVAYAFGDSRRNRKALADLAADVFGAALDEKP